MKTIGRNAAVGLWLLTATGVLAQTATQPTPLPGKHIPPQVMMELRMLENQFDLSLGRDCAPERCVSKGCVYEDHGVVDLPRNSSLPGLGSGGEGLGSVPAQEYLTRAHCDFAHEKSVSARDVQALTKRLEQRLAKGWLQVTIGHQILEPISESLRESPTPPVKPAPVEPPKAVEPPSATEPQKWQADIALRELWTAMLPHFSWMTAIVLVTLAAMFIIWALRRLGTETIEEKAMLAQLNAQPPGGSGAAGESKDSTSATTAETPEGRAEAAFLEAQREHWGARVAKTDLAQDDGVVVELLREWLRTGEFALLAKATFLFGDRLTIAFPSDGESAVKKVEFAEYMRTLDPAKLPTDAEFFRVLNQNAISASLRAQFDAGIYLSVREEFGSTGIAGLIERLPDRHGALLYGLVPIDVQTEVARALPPPTRLELAQQLLRTNRISREERSYLFDAIDAARAGLALPAAPSSSADDVSDRGREFDAAGALSVLLPFIEPKDRRAMFLKAYQRSNGALPNWYEGILYPDMLMKVPSELQADMLLEVDVRNLAGWSSLQPLEWQEGFLEGLSPSLQNAIRASMAFRSRADQLTAARKGHDELVASMKRLVTQGKVTFSEIVA